MYKFLKITVLFFALFIFSLNFCYGQNIDSDASGKKELKDEADKTLSEINALNELIDKNSQRQDAMQKELDMLFLGASKKSESAVIAESNVKAKSIKTESKPKIAKETTLPHKRKVIRLTSETTNKDTFPHGYDVITADEEAFDKEIIVNPPKFLAKNINKSVDPIKISGTYRMEFGAEAPGDVIWKKADADWGEKNWRYIFGEKRENTYDPGIFSQVVLNGQTQVEGPVNAYVQFVVDPWSYVGTSSEDTFRSSWGDSISDIKLRYWSNSGRTIAQNYRSSTGDSYAIPEMKVVDGYTPAASMNGSFTNQFNQSSNLTVPIKEINMEFKPIRKLWVDYTKDKLKIRVFPFADQAEALTSDDPLKLSNNRVSFWQASPWLYEWQPGQFFTGGMQAFQRGYWDDTLAHRVRDSDGNRLTLLRGISVETDALKTNFKLTAAAPLGLWYDYSNVNNIPVAVRTKTEVNDRLTFGTVYTFREGFRKTRADVINQVMGFDAEVALFKGMAFKTEFAMSQTKTDQFNLNIAPGDEGRFDKWLHGQAAKGVFSYSTKRGKDSYNTDFLFTYMGSKFDPTLSDYRQTRSDPFWSRHITFQPRSAEVESYRIGNGVDKNRYVWQSQTKVLMFDKKLDTLFDYRSVYRVSDNKYIESVYRSETAYKVTKKLTSKFLMVYQDRPQTRGGIDPLIAVEQYHGGYANFDVDWINNSIADDKNPSNFTGSAGLRYEFTPKIAGEVIYERSNYYYFPHGLLNGVGYGRVLATDGQRLDDPAPFLYSQNFFPLPFWRPHNIYQLRCELKPISGMILTLEHVRNGFKYNVVDETMNHDSLDVSYDMTRKTTLRFNYTYSKVIDIYRQVMDGQLKYGGHHNLYTGMDYKVSDDTLFKIEYGVSPGYPIDNQYSAVWQLPTLDTQHIFRASYSGKF